MILQYDPADNEKFWEAIRHIPGYPASEQGIPVQVMIFESDALFRLPQVLGVIGVNRKQPVLAVMDKTPMQRGADSLKPMLLKVLREAGWEVSALELEPDHTGQVHTDMTHIQTVKDKLGEGIATISVGSGTVTDITKHACHLYEQETSVRIPYVAYQTANSVSAYTSNMAPTFIDGVKRTLDSRYPDALVCDLETLADAPREMTAAGVGDLLAMYIAYPDWYLAFRLGMDSSYNGFPWQLMGPVDELCEYYAADIREATPAGMAILAKLISLVGLALSLSHNTTPLSGYEHVMSHTMDMLNESRGNPLGLHGSQVALATVLLSSVYQIFLAEFDPAIVSPDRCFPEEAATEDHVLRTFHPVDPSGKAGEECWSDYRIKLEKWRARRNDLESFLKDWGTVRAEIQALTRPPERLVEILRASGAPLRFAELIPPVGEAEVKFAFLNAPLIRKRLTFGDLLIFLSWERESLFQRAWQESWRLSQTF